LADSVKSGACCRSSVVEHSIGNGEVDSSILSGSTSYLPGYVDFIGDSVLGATQASQEPPLANQAVGHDEPILGVTAGVSRCKASQHWPVEKYPVGHALPVLAMRLVPSQTLAPCEPSKAHADKDSNYQDHKCDQHAKRPGVSVRSRPTLPSHRLRLITARRTPRHIAAAISTIALDCLLAHTLS
jgi:hypothetical protein